MLQGDLNWNRKKNLVMHRRQLPGGIQFPLK